MVYRKHVRHQTAKNFQIDLFTPDDGHFEYYAVATNMTWAPPRSSTVWNRGRAARLLLAAQVVVADTDIVGVLFVGTLVIFAQSSAIAPFIYTLFWRTRCSDGTGSRHAAQECARVFDVAAVSICPKSCWPNLPGRSRAARHESRTWASVRRRRSYGRHRSLLPPSRGKAHLPPAREERGFRTSGNRPEFPERKAVAWQSPP